MRWKEHFQQVLNRADPHRLADIPEAADDLEINLDQITEAEVREAIKAQKNGKAPGSDSVCAEMLKADEQETPRILCQIFQRIWDEEDTPDDWKTGTIIKLPKKGDLGNCNNWQGITLLSMTCKIFSRIILKRISAATDTILRQEQTGFRRGKSCIDHIFTLRQILEQSTEWNSMIYIAFIDFEKVFDSLHRESLWRILRHYGIPQKMVNVIKILYTDVQCQVACNSHMSDSFSIKSGVKQGCILSPTG